jgi:hypothetical protein
MDNWLLALFFKPFFAALLLCLLYAIKAVFTHYLPDSKFKQVLLTPLFKSK